MTITLSDICMPLDKAREWKEAGGRQDTIFCWCELNSMGSNRLGDFVTSSTELLRKRPPTVDGIAAPTVAEAMIWLSPESCWKAHDDFWVDTTMEGEERYRKSEHIWDRLIWLQREGRL